MKIRILLLLILLAIVALIVVNSLPEGTPAAKEVEKKEQEYQTILLKETELTGEQLVEGTLIPSSTAKIRFEVGGTLEKGDVSFKAGQEFKFNQLLMKVNMYEIFKDVSELKIAMEQTLSGLLPEIGARFPKELTKWEDFIDELDQARRLPAFPLLASKEEGDLLRSSGFLKQYLKAADLEDEIEKYFFLAPFDGKVLSVVKRPGNKVKPGEVVGVIAKKGAQMVSFDATLRSSLNSKDPVDLQDSDGKVIGTGKFRRMDGSKAIYTFIPKGNYVGPVFLKTTNGVKCFRIPASSISENKVHILTGETVTEREITVLKETVDSVYVNGLKEGEILILR